MRPNTDTSGKEKVNETAKPNNNPWEDLIVAILAVNQYTLEKTYVLLPGLREAGITEPRNLSEWNQEQMLERLRAAGCERGNFMTALFAQRLCALGELIQSLGIAHCEAVLTSRNPKTIEEMLMPVKGIGPIVLENFYCLSEIG